MKPAFAIEPLGPQHDRQGFSCGSPPLDRYLRELASQDIKRRISHCFVAVADGVVAGYYTIAAASVPLADLPADVTKRLPRYPSLPAALIGRLAVDTRRKGGGLGGALIVDAALRASRADPAVFAILVDAKDETAVRFYERLGFRRFRSRPDSLFLPLATALRAFDGRSAE